MAKTLSIVFGVLTVCGTIYVFANGGRANAGYAVIPMLLCVMFNRMAHKKSGDQ